MAYSSLYLHKKSRKEIGILLVCVFVVSFIAIVVMGQRPSPFPEEKKQQLDTIEIVNLFSNQAGILWTTKDKESGLVRYGREEKILDHVEYDERDIVGSPSNYINHLVTLKELRPDTDYYFEIQSNNGVFVSNKNKPFHLKTLPLETRTSYTKPVYGKVIEPNGKASANSMVVLRVGELFPFATITKETGEWLIPLRSLTSQVSGKTNVDVADNQRFDISITSEENQTSHISGVYRNISSSNKTVVLGQQYNLLAEAPVLGVATENDNFVSKIKILYPRENAIIPALRPLFKGMGIADTDIMLFINSSPQFSYRTKVDNKGEWRVLPTNDIQPGSYLVTVTAKNEAGSKVTLKRNFMIAKSGEQVLGEATAEPMIIPTVVPSPTGEPSPTQIPPGVPTPSPTPILPTVSAPTPTNIPYVYPSPTMAPPTTGGNYQSFYIASFVLVVLGAGLMLVF
ncbi:hypothetical protein COY90_05545 [Candidatus Roizmanbacteria bacterium CG_4_10_14_0_8_um_filter_39_9]|uniref:Fibronectin type-III domain-containing protein n=1 Tax=Candidatus Roizmanbacteria bacterium CG_4_10_14_0_8_um_filter_39_9 TaxID=1974829 RepID=A0A2M7QB97_9BACT|nr:MAG: hypothetical protein COY90_05545 [Candidatus Roizmanbacteria bacterium CG_4_10_14_0_8_um_filter_39_9]